MSDIDERYATFREHAELREWTAKIDATVQQIPTSLARIETMLASARPAVDHSALAAHRVLDDLPQIIHSATQKAGSGTNPILLAFAIIGALALGALGYHIATGG